MEDFEMDLIIEAKRREVILMFTDRKPNFAIIQALPHGRKAQPWLKEFFKRPIYLKRRGQLHSITKDGSEFMAFDELEKALKVPILCAGSYTTQINHTLHISMHY